MTGTLLYDPVPDGKYVRVEFGLDDAHRIAFSDPRRFGTGLLLDSESLDPYFAARLGLEPFDPEFDSDHLFELMRGRNAPIKSFLLDQRRIAGIGNIYADEALFRAGIHPLRRPAELKRQQAERLREGIVDALAAGIEAGGATIDDFRDPDGAWGAYQSEFLVHRREGQDCPDCGQEIRRMVVGGRSTYCCEACQPRPRRPRS
jgi:formamidopyrimidine-DNA glycosylase